MLQDWAFAQKGHGIVVQTARGEVTVLEFNEFLGRIASGQVGPDDIIVSQVMTDGVRRRVGDLRLYAQVRSGQVQTESLPRRVPGGVLATGLEAREQLPPLQSEALPVVTAVSLQPPVALLNVGLILAWGLALVGFSLLCSQRPGTPGTHPTVPVRFRPASHPEHPPWLPR
jgi:hypothetical protein